MYNTFFEMKKSLVHYISDPIRPIVFFFFNFFVIKERERKEWDDIKDKVNIFLDPCRNNNSPTILSARI